MTVLAQPGFPFGLGPFGFGPFGGVMAPADQATVVQLADAVAAGINQAGLLDGYFSDPPVEGEPGPFNTQPVQAARRIRPLYDLPELQILHVTILPVDRKGERQTTGKIVRYEYAVDLIIQHPMTPTDVDTLGPPLVLLTEQICDLFANAGAVFLANGKPANWLSVKDAPVNLLDEMEQQNTFTAPQRMTFSVMR